MEDCYRQFKDFTIPVAPSTLYDIQYKLYISSKHPPSTQKRSSLQGATIISFPLKASITSSPIVKK
jgi:hypothetical protein